MLCRLFRLLSERVLPPGNRVPPSLHTMQGVLGDSEVQAREYHVCINDCARFEYAPKDKWQKHRDERCPTCQEKRFKERRGAGGELLLSPRKVRQINRIQGSYSWKPVSDP